MKNLLRHIKSAVIVLVILALGVGGFGVLVATSPTPEGESAPDPSRLVKAFPVRKSSHRIAITAYGVSRAAEEWTALAEVSARVVEIDDRFEEGEILPAGAEILRIETTDFQLAVDRLQSDVRVQELRLKELDQQEKNAQSIRSFQQEQLKVAESELNRMRRLTRQNSSAPTELERAQSAYLDRRTALEQVQNDLRLLPVRKELQQATLDASRAQLRQSERDLQRCVIKLPFTAMCTGRQVERFQKVSVGQTLGGFLGLEKAEIVAMVEPRKILMLYPRIPDLFGSLDLSSGEAMEKIREVLDQLQAPVDITWRAGKGQAQWRGKMVRLGAAMDQQTRTVPTIVEVKDAFKDIRPGVRPALVPGMFCEVRIYGEIASDVFVIPRTSLHDDRVYVSRDDKLHIAEVNVLALEDDLAVIDQGLKEGDHVLLTELFPAVEEMPLRVEEVANPVSFRRELPELHSDLTPSTE